MDWKGSIGATFATVNWPTRLHMKLYHLIQIFFFSSARPQLQGVLGEFKVRVDPFEEHAFRKDKETYQENHSTELVSPQVCDDIVLHDIEPSS